MTAVPSKVNPSSEPPLAIGCDKGLTLETSAFQIFQGGNLTFINSFENQIFVSLSDRRSTTVSLETGKPYNISLVLLSVPVFVTLAIGICQELLGCVKKRRNSLCKIVHLIAFLMPCFLQQYESRFALVEFESETLEGSSSTWGKMSRYRITHQFLEFIFVAIRRRRPVIASF